MSIQHKSSEDAHFYAFPHLVTSFKSWMGQTGRSNKHDSHLALTLLGNVQASRGISHPPCGFALTCSVLLPTTQSHNRDIRRMPTSWEHPCRCVEKSKCNQKAAGTTQYSSAIPLSSGSELTFHPPLLKLLVTESIQEYGTLHQRDSDHIQAL